MRATDQAGNPDPSPAERSFTIDTVAPETTIDSGPASPTNDNTPSFSFSSSELGSSFQCRRDSGGWLSCSSPYDLIAVADGSHSFEVRAADPAGNTDLTPVRRDFTVDTLAPDTTIDSGPSGLTADNDPSFGFSSEPGATFECRLDSGSWAACTSPKAHTDVADGAHSFSVRATDAAGNTDPTPATRGFTVDATAPDTMIDSGPSGTITTRDVSFAVSATEPSSFECSLDGTPFGACSTPVSYSGLADGAHNFRVRATDNAGNRDPTPATRDFTVTATIPGPPPATTPPATTPPETTPPDTTPPETVITKHPKKRRLIGGTRAKARFAFTSSEAGSSFQCKLDRRPWKACVSPKRYKVKLGKHRFRVRATDAAGNTDPTAALWKWTLKAKKALPHRARILWPRLLLSG